MVGFLECLIRNPTFSFELVLDHSRTMTNYCVRQVLSENGDSFSLRLRFKPLRPSVIYSVIWSKKPWFVTWMTKALIYVIIVTLTTKPLLSRVRLPFWNIPQTCCIFLFQFLFSISMLFYIIIFRIWQRCFLFSFTSLSRIGNNPSEMWEKFPPLECAAELKN